MTTVLPSRPTILTELPASRVMAKPVSESLKLEICFRTTVGGS